MPWKAEQVFPFDQRKYTAGMLAGDGGRGGKSSDPLNAKPATSAKAALDTRAAGTSRSHSKAADRAKSANRKVVLDHAPMVAAYVEEQGFCASFSLIWIRAALMKPPDERLAYLLKSTKSEGTHRSRLEVLAFAYADPKKDSKAHAAEAGIARTDPVYRWSHEGSEPLHAWLFALFDSDSGWNPGTWNLTRQRKGGRHRFGIHSDGKSIWFFNPTRGEWIARPTKSDASTKRAAFSNMLNAVSLEADGTIEKIDISICTART